MTPLDAYNVLEKQERRMHAVHGSLAILHWDRAVIMPSGSSETRAEQLAGLSVILHEMETAPDRDDLVARAREGQDELSGWQKANLDEIERGYARARALAPDLVERKARLSAQTEMIWRRARETSDFAAIAPSFGELLDLVREEAVILGEILDRSPYEALLDKYEPDLQIEQVERLFSTLETALPDLLGKVLDRQAEQAPMLPLDGPFEFADQEKLSREIMAGLGFDFERGRLDVSHHPFTGGVPGDIRITTRYEQGDFIQALMATIHETGHALYEAGLPVEWRTQPVGMAHGMVMHESQSLLFEMQAARSPQFVAYLARRARAAFKKKGEAWQGDNFLRHYHKVSRGLIRVYADEVSYPLHVILRTSLERQMIAGTLKVADLPEAWNTAMQEHLDVRPGRDGEGCLQDIHWYSGAFGYFPTYTLGALAAAQIYREALRENKGIEADLGKGKVSGLRSWLGKNIHHRASRYSTTEIIEKTTGGRLDANVFLEHLKTRYLN